MVQASHVTILQLQGSQGEKPWTLSQTSPPMWQAPKVPKQKPGEKPGGDAWLPHVGSGQPRLAQGQPLAACLGAGSSP